MAMTKEQNGSFKVITGSVSSVFSSCPLTNIISNYSVRAVLTIDLDALIDYTKSVIIFLVSVA